MSGDRIIRQRKHFNIKMIIMTSKNYKKVIKMKIIGKLIEKMFMLAKN